MHFKNPVYFLLTFLFMSCSQNNLYQSETFTIKSDRVLQNGFEAIALTRAKMTSNYISDYRMPTKREVFFKFSLNGRDNERFPGEDHRIFLKIENHNMISTIYIFGESDPQMDPKIKIQRDPFLDKDIAVTFRCDIRNVLRSFQNKGFFITKTGDRIKKEDFHGIYIVGNMLPLTWDFSGLADNPKFKLTDPDNDGIYEITLTFKRYQQETPPVVEQRSWQRNKDLSKFPQLESPHLLIDALYNLSLEELMLNIRDDSAFMAGKKWPGVWTRDISYSIMLSLAALLPEESKNSLMAKVDKNRIIQDTGTGGSWPVSTDRMTWSLAAWEIYAATGDSSWLKYAYKIIRNSAEADLLAAFDTKSGLFYGESSFLDWREQTYPHWMDPKDIYQSLNLGTNAVHYQTYRILAQMAGLLGYNPQKFSEIADRIKLAINKKMWNENAGFFGQYLYGRNFLSLSERSETLGEALCILFNIADAEHTGSIFKHMPVTRFGPTCIFPQIPDIPPYHNNGIWPFVVAYWTWAAAEAQNSVAVEFGLASILRAAALFLTNKENFVADTGDYMGTEINSDRQLWSVAGYLAMVYRVLFGISFDQDRLFFKPFIPKNYGGTWVLSNFRYRQVELKITIEGYGSEIADFIIDDTRTDKPSVSSDLKGSHNIQIRLAHNHLPSVPLNLVQNTFSPATPHAKLANGKIAWNPSDKVTQYIIYENGKKIAETKDTEFEMMKKNYLQEYQIQAVDIKNMLSFLSEPVTVIDKTGLIHKELEWSIPGFQKKYTGYSGDGYIKITQAENTNLNIPIEIIEDGLYVLDLRYANGSGPVNTNNKCAIRSLYVDGIRTGVFVFPQRGTGNWEDWGFSNSVHLFLSRGYHRLQLIFEESNENMNRKVNSALLDYLRILRIKVAE